MISKIRDTQLSRMGGTMVGVLTGTPTPTLGGEMIRVLTGTPHPALPRKGGGEAEETPQAA